jgi:SLOG in TRPM, prokaryote/SMODS and SLOG-associating 2TM effector domain 1/Protein of unknown function (DUF4231)
VDTPQTSQAQHPKAILFPNGNRALLLAPPAGTNAADIIQALGIGQPKALILVVGGAADLDATVQARLVQLCSRGIARAAANISALIMDGGTQAGVMALVGQGVADRGRKTALVGIAPAGKITYPDGPVDGNIVDGAALDPNHSHFVLVESSEWGGETETMYAIAEALAKTIPVVTVLINGGTIARDEVLRSVRQGWPIIVVQGSGRLADEIATSWQEKPSFIIDPVLAEVIADGTIHLFPLDGPVAALEDLITRQLHGDTTLKLAWERFALYDTNAVRQQTSFRRLQLWILALGVLGTLLVLTQTTLISQAPEDQLLMQKVPGVYFLTWGRLLHIVIVLVPITLAILVAAANRFNAGNKWVVLRASAEAIKGEIFRYRTRAASYLNPQMTQLSREATLVSKIESISHKLMQTDVNLSALRLYTGRIPPQMGGTSGTDDGLSFLTPERYVSLRLVDQLTYYQGKAISLERQLRLLQWSVYILGGVGTLLAALEFELWIALTIALVTACTTYLGYQQIDNTLMKYNQAATDLVNVQAWWTALPLDERANQQNVDRLVEDTERILASELTGWVQEMRDALTELRAQQARKEESKNGAETEADQQADTQARGSAG